MNAGLWTAVGVAAAISLGVAIKERTDAGDARRWDRFVETADQFEQRFDAGDLEGLAALYADEAVMFPPAEEPVAGRDAIAGYYDQLFALGVGEIEMEHVEIGRKGDMAYRTATFAVALEDGKPFLTGRALEIWKYDDGEWRIWRDMWN